jgi:diaminopimelate epimerase
MHGLGNDMIVVDGRGSGFTPTADQARYICDRRRGVGADQMLILLPSSSADFKMRIFNQDGSEVEMCGNGIRCLALYIHERGISASNPLEIETLAGVIRPERRDGMVRVDMGEPVFDPEKIPVSPELARAAGNGKIQNCPIEAGGHHFVMSAVSMGNPHCVIPVDDVDGIPLETIGPLFEHHPWFPKRTNVEFTQVVDRGHLRVRVWERGAGATLACGTGACGAAVALMDLGRADRRVIVALPGGNLDIEWDQATNRVFMTGPAVFVFDATIEL